MFKPLESWVTGDLLSRLVAWPQSKRFGCACEALEADSAAPASLAENYVRLMPQCRLVYSLLKASELSADARLKAQAQSRAEKIFSQIISNFAAPDITKAGFQFALGEPTSNYPQAQARHLYAHAFVILAAATFYQHSQQKQARDVALQTLQFICQKFRCSQERGFVSLLSPELKAQPMPLEQNPHMHLLEACLAAFSATGSAEFLVVAREIVELWQTHWVKGEVLIEFMDSNWEPDALRGHVIEPGHHFEWVWLIERWIQLTTQVGSCDSLTSRIDISPAALRQSSRALLTYAIKHGLSRSEGKCSGIYDEVSRIDASVIDSRKRIWPITEALKALPLGAQSHIVESSVADQLSQELIDLMLSNYRLKNGLWVERWNSDFSSRDRTDCPASTPYHIVCCAWECARAGS